MLTIQLGATVKPPFTGLAILLALRHNNSHDRLPALFRDWSRWSAGVLYSHRASPILMEFRSAQDGEWLAALGALLDSATLVLAYLDGEELVEEFSAAREFYLTGGHAVLELARLFHLEDAREKRREVGRSADEEIRRALHEAGYPLSDEHGSGQRAETFRSSYLDRLRAVAEQFDLRVESDLLARAADNAGPLADEKDFYRLG